MQGDRLTKAEELLQDVLDSCIDRLPQMDRYDETYSECGFCDADNYESKVMEHDKNCLYIRIKEFLERAE